MLQKAKCEPCNPFLPAAKPTGHRTMRVIVVVVVIVVGGDYFEVMTLKTKVNFSG